MADIKSKAESLAKSNSKKNVDSKNKVKSSKTKSTIEKELEKNAVSTKLVPPTVRYIEPKVYSICRVGTEVYITDEENYVPYVSSFNQAASGASDSSDESDDKEKKEGEEEEEQQEEEEEEDNKGYKLHCGEIIGTHYVNNINGMSFESDYKEMTTAGNIKVDSIDLTKSYKGVRLQLLSQWEDVDSKLKWEDLSQGVLGFITEQTFTNNNVDIKVNGMTILMEQNVNFDFQQMKRSEIIREVILTAGLKPQINVDGLDDDVTDFKNASESGGSGDDGGTTGSTGSASIDEAVKNAIKGKSDPLAKAKAIDKAFKNHVYYSYYYDCHFSDIDKAWKNAHLNCADGANVLCAMFIAGGLKAVIVHVPGHYIVKLTIKGSTYYTDNAASTGSHTTRPFGQVWNGNTSGSVVGTKISM